MRKSEAKRLRDVYAEAEPVARANAARCHDPCLRRARAIERRGSSVTFGKDFMRAINTFLVSQNVDVGRSFSLLTFSSAVGSFFGMLGAWLMGRFTIDLSGPIGLFVGIALWLHVAWARKLLIFLGWLAVAAITAILAIIPFTGTAKLSLSFGSTVIQHPPLWQPYVFAVLAAPLLWFVLCVLHSEKARAEFQEPNQVPEPTPMAVTPPAAQEPRQP